jgi:hypothetical protein
MEHKVCKGSSGPAEWARRIYESFCAHTDSIRHKSSRRSSTLLFQGDGKTKADSYENQLKWIPRRRFGIVLSLMSVGAWPAVIVADAIVTSLVACWMQKEQEIQAWLRRKRKHGTGGNRMHEFHESGRCTIFWESMVMVSLAFCKKTRTPSCETMAEAARIESVTSIMTRFDWDFMQSSVKLAASLYWVVRSKQDSYTFETVIELGANGGHVYLHDCTVDVGCELGNARIQVIVGQER